MPKHRRTGPAPMATLRFDSGLRFDTGLHYDADAPTPVSPRGPLKGPFVNIIKLELQKKTIDEKITLGQNVISNMTGNTNYPAASRAPTDAEFQTAQDDLVTANGTVNAAETAWKAAILERDVKAATWDATITARASNCEGVTPGDRAALATTGMPLRALPTPVGVLPAPINFLAQPTNLSGELRLSWKAVHGATSYIVECKEHGTPDPWVQVKVVSGSRMTVTGLTSGKTYAFRVRAIGAAGEGGWSDETVKMAP